MIRIVLDIDGVLCTDTGGEYEEARPRPEMIALCNRLYEDGHEIILHTGRGSRIPRPDVRNETARQLEAWGVKYHELIMGKPAADYYVDNHAVRVVSERDFERFHALVQARVKREAAEMAGNGEDEG